jgi:hypothetical protein
VTFKKWYSGNPIESYLFVLPIFWTRRCSTSWEQPYSDFTHLVSITFSHHNNVDELTEVLGAIHRTNCRTSRNLTFSRSKLYNYDWQTMWMVLVHFAIQAQPDGDVSPKATGTKLYVQRETKIPRGQKDGGFIKYS